MSARPKTESVEMSRLAQVLWAGFEKLSLEMPYGSKRSSAGAVKSNVESLGLQLKSPFFQTVTSGPFPKRLGRRLSTVTIRRTNTGTAPGVVFDESSTVLIINAESGYGDKYLDYLMKVRAGKTTAELPNIHYFFPVSQNSSQSSAYVTKARAHLLNLIKEATLESIGKAEFSNDFEQPLTKIFVFFKIPVTGLDALRNDGPYIYFGRFKALNNQSMIQPGDKSSSFTDAYLNRITSIGLRPFDTPKPPASNPRLNLQQMSAPLQATEVVEGDLEVVIQLLGKMSLKDNDKST